MNRIKSLDSLRGIACLIVLFAHIIASDPIYGMYANGCGKIGVWCFLLLSGFLSFLPYAEGKIFNINKLTAYYSKKIKRLYPAYVIVLCFSLLLGVLTSALDVGKHILCIEGWGHFWYMPVVIKFYIAFPFIAWLYCAIPKKVFYLCVLFLGIILSILFPFTAYIENSINLYWYMPVFLMGILLAGLFTELNKKTANNVMGDILAISSLVLIVLFTPLFREVFWEIEPSRWLQNKYLLMGLLWAVFVISMLFSTKVKNWLEKYSLLLKLGNLSYEIYLIHYIFLVVLNPYISNTVLRGFTVTIFSIILAYLLQYVTKKIT